MYKKINTYSEDSLNNTSNLENREYPYNKNWYNFSGVGGSNIGDKREIKRLLQFLSYSFIFNYEKKCTSTQDNTFKYELNKSSFLKYLQKDVNDFPEYDKNNESNFINEYEKLYFKKGSLEKMINNYSEFIAYRGNDIDFINEEFFTLFDFFNLTFEPKGKNDRFNINNLCMIYLILRENNLLKNNDIVIPKEAIYYNNQSMGLNASGFYNRIREIKNILVNKEVL